MDCAKCQECTKSYIDGTLPDNLVLEYCAHLETCPKCKEDLIVNYALVNALRSLNENRELSSDYVKEVDDRLEASKNAILHAASMRKVRRVLVFLEMMCIMVFASIFPPIEKTYAFLPEESEEHFVLEINGVPSFIDPVIRAIYRYNDDVLKCIRERERLKREQEKAEASEESGLSAPSVSSETADDSGKSLSDTAGPDAEQPYEESEQGVENRLEQQNNTGSGEE